MRQRAATGFLVLGPDARGAVLDLVRIVMAERPAPSARGMWAMQCLAYVGQDGMSALLRIAGDEREVTSRRVAALTALENADCLGTNALPAMPVLTACALGTNKMVASAACRVLGSLAYPDLSLRNWTPTGVRLQHADPIVRRAALRAAGQTATNDFAYDLLMRGKYDVDPVVQAEVARAIALRQAYVRSQRSHE